MIAANFGRRVRFLRNKKGLSQEKFALLAGLDRTYYASIENGKRNVSLINIYKLAVAFGISISELFEGVEDNA